MDRPIVSTALVLFSVAPFALLLANQDPPRCEEVYKNITVFKGVPASDLIPSMEFMCASLQWKCSNCHNTSDYSAETQAKETAREMVLIQRDINARFFNNRNTVTCMTCHRSDESPVNIPTPDGLKVRHARATGAPKPDELFAKHIAAAGQAPTMLVRTGTLTAPNDATGKVETEAVELDQAPGGKFRIAAKSRTIVSDGVQATYGGQLLDGDPAATFQRIGRAWLGEGAFAGLDGPFVSGKEKLGEKDVIVVRADRASSGSTEELYFDTKSGLLLRSADFKRSSLGTFATMIDYDRFKSVGGSKLPMKVTVTFASGETWVMEFKSSKSLATADGSLFKVGQ